MTGQKSEIPNLVIQTIAQMLEPLTPQQRNDAIATVACMALFLMEKEDGKEATIGFLEGAMATAKGEIHPALIRQNGEALQ